jgi:hypothetical protein
LPAASPGEFSAEFNVLGFWTSLCLIWEYNNLKKKKTCSLMHLIPSQNATI